MDDSQALHALYEKFVLEYYKKHHPHLSPCARRIDAKASLGAPAFLPKLCADIVLEGDEKVLIIDAKCYGDILSVHYGKELLSPDNRAQIFSYVAHEQYKNPKRVEGMLLYALTEHDRQLHEDWVEAGIRLHCYTLDLGRDFSGIADQLDDIADMV